MSTLAELVEAIDAVAALDAQLWDDIGERFTCGELEAIAGLLDAVGIDTTGLRDAHARGDEEGDQHWTG